MNELIVEICGVRYIPDPKQLPPPLPTKSEQVKTEVDSCFDDYKKHHFASYVDDLNRNDVNRCIAFTLQWKAAQKKPNYDQLLNAVAIAYSNRDFIKAESGTASTALALLWQEFKQLEPKEKGGDDTHGLPGDNILITNQFQPSPEMSQDKVGAQLSSSITKQQGQPTQREVIDAEVERLYNMFNDDFPTQGKNLCKDIIRYYEKKQRRDSGLERLEKVLLATRTKCICHDGFNFTIINFDGNISKSSIAEALDAYEKGQRK